MIHYNHNTGKHRNIQLSKPRGTVMQQHRRKQAKATIKDMLKVLAIVSLTMLVLGGTYYFKTM